MTPEETTLYLNRLYQDILEHRYRYYVLAKPVLEDFVYDFVEKFYNKEAQENGIRLMEMVDFDFKDPEAIEAGKRVDAATDKYSEWEKSMNDTWARLGRPKD